MLTRETMRGPWAGLPVAWTPDDRFDEAAYRDDIARCCRAGAPGIYTGGTTGEFYAMEFEEFQAVTRSTVEVAKAHNRPVMIGCSSTHTLGVARRAAFAAEQGADAIQVALPFWLKIHDSQILPFFKDVSKAARGLVLSIYETTRAKKTLTLDQHRAIKDAVPDYLMVKANASTLGDTRDGCQALSEFVNVFVGEDRWAELSPFGACGACSSAVYWNPRVTLDIWKQVEQRHWPAVQQGCDKLHKLFQFLGTQWGEKGFEDSAFDRLGGVAGGFLKTSLQCRRPYPYASAEDVRVLREWYRNNFPEMLEF